MDTTTDYLRSTLANDLATLLNGRLDADRAAQARSLALPLLAALPTADLENIDVDQIFAAVVGLLGFMRKRAPDTALVRVFNPEPESHGWASAHTVLEIVNDDMPFLVDSVAMRLAGLGLGIHQMLHPIIAISRDGAGQIATIGEGLAESLMHIQIDRQEPGVHADIVVQISAVLAEVRAAVADWRRMRDKLGEITAGLEGGGGEDMAEARALLQWLHDDHFTFLGYRHFLFGGDQSAPVVSIEDDTELGILRARGTTVFDDSIPLEEMPGEIRAFLTRPTVLMVTKSASLSCIHRPVHMDVIGVKSRDANGRVIGLHAFTGLFTAAAYTSNPSTIPLLRRKVAQVVQRAAFSPHSHDAKALSNILEIHPRDELFQIGEELLYHTALGILRIQDRPRVALFVRPDDFRRFVSCLVYLPRDRYDTPLRLAVIRLLEQAFGGRLDAYYTQVADGPLARLHVMIRTPPGAPPASVDHEELESRIALAARSWSDQVQDALVHTHGESAGLALSRRWRDAFPASYRERQFPLTAVGDVERLERVIGGADIGLALYRPIEADQAEARLKLVRKGDTVALSDILPILENMGLRVIAEVPHEIVAADLGVSVWIHDFQMRSVDSAAIDLEGRAGLFEEALAAVWRGQAESDGFNRLVLVAGLSWRQVVILRAYAKFLRQAGSTLSQSYVERALAANPAQAGALVGRFETLFDPDLPADSARDDAGPLIQLLDQVVSADDDRILRRFHALIEATLRTNYFLDRDYVSLKLHSAVIEDLPLPKPRVEIFVYSPRVEAVHLRGGPVARGGIRWSDRREDFRTEILGLMKAQMVKNAVIVPVGAKGGFVVKRAPAEGGREAMLAEGIACYQTMMRGLLDLTDNLAAGQVVPPAGVIRRDGDDPYLVVAADKGTASFSDIANALSLEYGFWLGDAFASGGSKGYDHKAMGITARGAWEAVKRHFREMGIDTQASDFTVVGVGDMSGDVFGNAMLCSPHIRLVGAFNHAHIFIDPNPDAAESFAERERLFRAAKAWGEYDTHLISAGGGVFPRTAKSIRVSAEMAQRFGIDKPSLTPAELIRVLLTAPVDLLFFGGIGTYVKASGESNADAGDRANDAIRIDGAALRAHVLGEGANLGATQRGRIEFALKGGRINTDAIDNSAGVDTSDHEVNIKILTGDVVGAGDMTPKQRDLLLAGMTDEVAALVLRDNYLQTQALSVMEQGGVELLDGLGRFMRLLERGGRLDRAIEFLPTDDLLLERAAHRRGLTRPELAVLLAYAKIWLHDAVIGSALPDDPFLAADLARYFPAPLRDGFGPQIAAHRLRRDIVATGVTNSIINRVGVAFVLDLMERTGYSAAEVARAYIIARDAYGLRDVWAAIEAEDGHMPAALQTELLVEANRLLERATAWVLRFVPLDAEIGATIAALAPGIAALTEAGAAILPPSLAEIMANRAQDYAARLVPEDLASRIARLIFLASAADIVTVATRLGAPVLDVGRLYFLVSDRFSLGWLRVQAQAQALGGHWQKLAAHAATEDLYGHQRALVQAVAASGDVGQCDQALEVFGSHHGAALGRIDTMIAELRAAPHLDLAMIVVANRQFRAMIDAL